MERIKYLDMENATLRMKLNSLEEYEKFFKEHSKDLIDLNFKRIYVKISSIDLQKFVSVFKNIELPLIIETELLEELNFNLSEDIVVINTNPKILSDNPYVYNTQILNETTLPQIIDLIKSEKNIVIDLDIDIQNINKINNCLTDLFSEASNKLLNICNFIVPTNLIKEHPCNCYLCNGWRCHKAISGLPKDVLLDENYNLYPHEITKQELKIGNIKTNNIKDVLKNYTQSKEYENFMICCKQVFIRYLPNYPFQYFPVAEYIKEVANEIL